MLTLRPYQREAIDIGIYQYFAEHQGNACVCVPTGGGKSLIIAAFLREVYEHWPDQRVLIVTHIRELILQDHAELMELWPEAPAGINSAGLKRREFDHKIIFGGIQSLHKHAYRLQLIDLVIIDEAHLVGRSSNTMYQRLLSDLKRINPHLKIIGLTATPYRLDSGMLHKGDDALFDAVSYEVNVRQLIDQGYLTRPRTVSRLTQIDTTGVGTRGGEFIPEQLQAAASDPRTVQHIADEIVKHGVDRRGWLIFATGVGHAKMLQEALQERGVVCASVFGETPSEERFQIIEDFKEQKIQALCSVGVFTTGFNAQHVDLIALARPTKSTGLYVQMVGRGLRNFPGKENVIILDFGGNVRRHGPIDAPNPKDPGKKGDGPAPYKTCPECETDCAINALECPECGYEFPLPEGPKIELTPAKEQILQLVNAIQWVDVDQVSYWRHEKPDKPPSMRVEYRCGMSVHREWVCFEHTGFPRNKAEAWWKARVPPQYPVPDKVQDALMYIDFIKKPSQISIRPSGRFTEIAGMKFERPEVTDNVVPLSPREPTSLLSTAQTGWEKREPENLVLFPEMFKRSN
jgi:DNA repair protein RadD